MRILLLAIILSVFLNVVNGLVNENMNLGGVPYDVANRVGSEYSTNFQENVKNKVEYFDVRIFPSELSIFLTFQVTRSIKRYCAHLHIYLSHIPSYNAQSSAIVHTYNITLEP